MLKKEVLRKQPNFQRIYNQGKSKHSRNVVVLFKKNSLDCTRYAFVASKKVGNSVKRNRARRYMKEGLFNIDKNKLKKGYDIVLVARNEINNATCDDVKKSVYGTLREAGLLEIGAKKNEHNKKNTKHNINRNS